MSSLGNPAPLGLICFGMTTLTLMYVDMGWAEVESNINIAALAIALGGFGQVLVGIIEIFKGSSFSFAVFECYGAFWLTWAIAYISKSDTNSLMSEQDAYPIGTSLYLAQWGVLSACFWVITLRKNICLITIFSLLVVTFLLLSIAAGTGNETVKKAGGYFGFFTAVGALYTGVAELINEEYGRMVMPGLAPMYTPQRVILTKDAVRKLINYDERSNTLWLQFRGLQIRTAEDVKAIRDGVQAAIEEALQSSRARKHNFQKVHVVADYEETFISEDVLTEYWEMASELQKQYYLSATRFHVSSFGTRAGTLEGAAAGTGTNMLRVDSTPNMVAFPPPSGTESAPDLTCRSVEDAETAPMTMIPLK